MYSIKKIEWILHLVLMSSSVNKSWKNNSYEYSLEFKKSMIIHIVSRVLAQLIWVFLLANCAYWMSIFIRITIIFSLILICLQNIGSNIPGHNTKGMLFFFSFSLSSSSTFLFSNKSASISFRATYATNMINSSSFFIIDSTSLATSVHLLFNIFHSTYLFYSISYS